MIINNKDTIQFKNPKVFLGHETKLVTEIIGLPETINTIQLKNTLFKDIYHSQSIVIFLLEQFPTQKFSLGIDNKYQINIALKDGVWDNILEEKTNSNFRYVGYFAILLVILAVFFVLKRRKTVK